MNMNGILGIIQSTRLTMTEEELDGCIELLRVGEVTKVKIKKALVRVGSTSWDVPIGMLSVTR